MNQNLVTRSINSIQRWSSFVAVSLEGKRGNIQLQFQLLQLKEIFFLYAQKSKVKFYRSIITWIKFPLQWTVEISILRRIFDLYSITRSINSIEIKFSLLAVSLEEKRGNTQLKFQPSQVKEIFYLFIQKSKVKFYRSIVAWIKFSLQ